MPQKPFLKLRFALQHNNDVKNSICFKLGVLRPKSESPNPMPHCTYGSLTKDKTASYNKGGTKMSALPMMGCTYVVCSDHCASYITWPVS